MSIIIYFNSKRQGESWRAARKMRFKNREIIFCAECAFYRFTYYNNSNKINNNKDTLFVCEDERRLRRIKHLARVCGRGTLLLLYFILSSLAGPAGSNRTLFGRTRAHILLL